MARGFLHQQLYVNTNQCTRYQLALQSFSAGQHIPEACKLLTLNISSVCSALLLGGCTIDRASSAAGNDNVLTKTSGFETDMEITCVRVCAEMVGITS